jgi:hypothetical protein
MAQNKVIRYYSKDLTIVLQFERLQSNVDMSDMVGHELLNQLTNNKHIKNVLRVSGYKVNQKVTTVDWDEKNKSFQPPNISGLVRKIIQ